MFDLLNTIVEKDNAVAVLALIVVVVVSMALLGVTMALVWIARKSPDDKQDDKNMGEMIKLLANTTKTLDGIQMAINRTTNIQVQHLALVEQISNQQKETKEGWDLKLTEHEARAADRHDEFTSTFEEWVKGIDEQLTAVRSAINLLPVSLQGISSTTKSTGAAVSRIQQSQMEGQTAMETAINEMKNALVDTLEGVRKEVQGIAEKVGKVFEVNQEAPAIISELSDSAVQETPKELVTSKETNGSND